MFGDSGLVSILLLAKLFRDDAAVTSYARAKFAVVQRGAVESRCFAN